MTHERIEVNPSVMFGKPVVRGTRITVESILRKLAGGMTIKEILADHPRLTADDVYAAAEFAADYMAAEKIVFVERQLATPTAKGPGSGLGSSRER